MGDAFFALGRPWKMIYRMFCGFTYDSLKTLCSKSEAMKAKQYDISFRSMGETDTPGSAFEDEGALKNDIYNQK